MNHAGEKLKSSLNAPVSELLSSPPTAMMKRDVRVARVTGRRLLVRLALLGASLIVSVMAAELTLRLFWPQAPSWLAIYRRHPVLPFYCVQPNLDTVVATGETRYRVLTDDEGFRVGRPESVVAHPRSEILWLGDSFTFGGGVNFEQSFVGGLAVRSGAGVRHVNAGVGGWGVQQYERLLEFLLERGTTPDCVVVVTYVGNDFYDCVWNKDVEVVGGSLGYRGDLKSLAATSSHLYRLLASAWHRVGTRGPNADRVKLMEELAAPDAWKRGLLAEAREKYRLSISRIVELCLDRGLPVRFVVLPTREAVEFERAGSTAAECDPDPRRPSEQAMRIIEEADEKGFDALSVFAEYPTKEIFFTFDGHLTPTGNAALAEALAIWWPRLIGRPR